VGVLFIKTVYPLCGQIVTDNEPHYTHKHFICLLLIPCHKAGLVHDSYISSMWSDSHRWWTTGICWRHFVEL